MNIMVTQYVRYFLLAAVVMLACSCAGVKPLTADRPADVPFRTALPLETSTINIPLETSADEIARVLNRTLATELYKGGSGTQGVSVTLLRSGSIAVSAADDSLYVTVPVSASFRYSLFELPAVRLNVKFRIRIAVAPDWRLTADIRYLGLSEQLADELRIGPVTIRPRSIVENMIQPLQRLLSEQSERKINDMVALKTQVTAAWNSAFTPQLLNREYNAWLRLTPRNVVFAPLTTRDNRVRVGVGITTCAELIVGQQPPASPLQPLPRLMTAAAPNRTFSVALNADLDYKELRSIATAKLLNRKIDMEGHQITITDLDVYGSGDRLVIKVRTTGSLEGLFYLTARPLFNQQSGRFSVTEVDFDMQTRDLLMLSADWFLHGTLQEMIQDKLNMDVSKRLDETRIMAGKALTRVPLTDHLYLTVDIRNLSLKEVMVQRDRISVRVSADGESSLLLQ